MMHPPTISHGPLHAHEVAELAELVDDVEAWIDDLDDVPDHLVIRIRWWALRLANTTTNPR
jgi:hypothetical protein